MRTVSVKRAENFKISGRKEDELFLKGIRRSFIVKGDFIAIKEEPSGEEAVYNGIVFRGKRLIESGDELRIGGYIITFLEGTVRIQSAAGEIRSRLKLLRDSVPFSGYPDYKRSPRIIKEIPSKKITIEKGKFDKPKKRGIGEVLRMILPPICMLIVTIIVGRILGRGLLMLMSIASTGVTAAMAIFQLVSSLGEGRGKLEEQRRVYENYLLRKRKEIYEDYRKEVKAHEYRYPSVRNIEGMIADFSDRLYERSVDDTDFLDICLGRTKGSSGLDISLKIDEIEGAKCEEEKDAIDMRREFGRMELPVVANLRNSNVGIVGEKAEVQEELLNIVAQLTFFQSYRDLQLIFIYGQESAEKFDALRWYPHTHIEALNVSGMINSGRAAEQVLGSLHRILKDRKNRLEEEKRERMFLPYYIFVVDETKFIANHSIMEYLEKSDRRLGFSVIYTDSEAGNLPESVRTVVKVKKNNRGRLVILDGKEKDSRLRTESMENIDFEWMSRNLSAINHVPGITSSIPDAVTFFGMYNVKKPEELDIETRWRKSDSAKSLAVPLGYREAGDIVYLNLHEKAHGPHGLVAGTTGSGKSEIIQSYIMSLAVNFSPYEVAFLLIDYKGGGMAGLFKKLPHLLGTITNLDGTQSMRAMTSIKAELARRQRVFSKYDVNHINAYNRLFKLNEAEEPMPHLFIISDEFAELKKEQPDFMKELVSAARIGRSLGVHLVLATQKPSGVVDDQIWTNSKFKLALMVQNEQDSKEILKTPDAAYITKPGRAYLQVGNNEIYELFQSAWSGAPFSKDEEEKKNDNRVYLINSLGQGQLINPDLSRDEGSETGRVLTELDATVEYINELYAAKEHLEIKKPWLPPLENQIVSPEKTEAAGGNAVNLLAELGLADIPEEQTQISYRIQLEKEGNIVYFAAAGYGKTVFLTTLILSLAMKNSPELLNFYILDFGNSGLITLNALHHTSDYIVSDDKERMQKFVKIINDTMLERKKLFAEKLVQNFEVYNQTSEKKMKAIVIVIDNFDASKELEGFEQFTQKVLRDGLGLGIYLAASAGGSNAMKYSTFNAFRNKIAAYLYDESEVRTIVGRSDYRSSEIKGRCLVKLGRRICMMQVYSMSDCETESGYNEKIIERVKEINEIYPDIKAPRIPVLPENLDVTDLLENYESPEGILPLGLDTSDVVSCGPDRSMTPFAIVGDSGKGKTNVLHLILSEIDRSSRVYIFDSKSLELYKYKDRENVQYIDSAEAVQEFVDTLEEEVAKRSALIMERVRENPGIVPRKLAVELEGLYIIIDDFDNFAELTKKEANRLSKLLPEADGCGIMTIFTVGANRLKGFDPVSQYAKAASDGLLLSGGGTTALFQSVSMRALPEFGEGLLMHNGSFRRLKIAKAE